MRSLLLVVALTLAAGTAQAQSGEYERARRSRVGLELGVGLQLGEIILSSAAS